MRIKNTNSRCLSHSVNRFRDQMHGRGIFAYLFLRPLINPCFENRYQFWFLDNFFRLIIFEATWDKTYNVFVQCIWSCIVPGGVVNHNRDVFFLYHFRVEKYLADVRFPRRSSETVVVGINLCRPQCVQANSVRIQFRHKLYFILFHAAGLSIWSVCVRLIKSTFFQPVSVHSFPRLVQIFGRWNHTEAKNATLLLKEKLKRKYQHQAERTCKRRIRKFSDVLSVLVCNESLCVTFTRRDVIRIGRIIGRFIIHFPRIINKSCFSRLLFVNCLI